MDRNTKRRSETHELGLVVCTDWCTGPRTLAWDRFWRAILTDLGPEPLDGSEPETRRGGDDD